MNVRLCAQCKCRVALEGRAYCAPCFTRDGSSLKTKTGLPAHEYSNPSVYVVAKDLAQVRGFVDANQAELDQWRLRDELGPTTLAIAAIASLFRGMRKGRDGTGVQLSVEEWARVLGRSERQVQYALRQGQARGFFKLRERFVEHPWTRRWTPKKGPDRGKAKQKDEGSVQVRTVLYLTEYGIRRIERRGETKKTWIRWGETRVGLVVCGAAQNLLEKTRSVLKVLARRISNLAEHCTPSFGEAPPIEKNHVEGSQPEIVGNSTGPPSGEKVPPDGSSIKEPVPPTHPSAAQRGPAWGSYGRGRFQRHLDAAAQLQREIDSLWSRRAFSPSTAWPDLWSTADERGKRFLTQEFNKYRVELARRLEAETKASSR